MRVELFAFNGNFIKVQEPGERNYNVDLSTETAGMYFFY